MAFQSVRIQLSVEHLGCLWIDCSPRVLSVVLCLLFETIILSLESALVAVLMTITAYLGPGFPSHRRRSYQ
jgi:ABC-type polysaccharide/polyol phosphate export permease